MPKKRCCAMLRSNRPNKSRKLKLRSIGQRRLLYKQKLKRLLNLRKLKFLRHLKLLRRPPRSKSANQTTRVKKLTKFPRNLLRL